MKKQNFVYSLSILLIGALLNFSCVRKYEPVQVPTPPLYGYLTGLISDASNLAAIEGAIIYVYNSDTKAPTGETATSDAGGNYTLSLSPGNYYIKVSKHGYYDVTPRGIPAIPFTISLSDTLNNSVEMYANNLTNIGWISGKVNSSSETNIGVLVVATDGSNGYSAVSDTSGNYVIYNVPVGTYDVQGWGAGFNSDINSATTTADAGVVDIDLNLIDGATGSVSGAVTFLATANKEVDVALTHPTTGESIPGLSTTTSGGNYTINSVPDGTFLARASFNNDEIVMDPDWIIKNGEPFVTVSGAAATRDFSVTNSILVISPTNAATSTSPTEITSTTPTFEWEAYSSTSDYVIEVRDANGILIWGGFNIDWSTKNITIPSSDLSIVFNSDGNATEALVVGNTYRWRIYASKDAGGGATWNLISASEEQMGLFTIVQ